MGAIEQRVASQFTLRERKELQRPNHIDHYLHYVETNIHNAFFNVFADFLGYQFRYLHDRLYVT